MAVTITAATFLVSMLVAARVLTPRRSSIDCRLCCVKGALRRLSPVLFRPTTKSIADQEILADSFKAHDVLDPRSGESGRSGINDTRTRASTRNRINPRSNTTLEAPTGDPPSSYAMIVPDGAEKNAC